MGAGSLKRKRVKQPEEVTFDFEARQEYLTGFHKRKLQRAKHAKEAAARKEREEKAKTRKLLRDKRKKEVEEHVEAVKDLIGANGDVSDVRDSDDEEKFDSGGWQGFSEPVNVNREDEFIDDDRYTTVTVEAVDVTRHGLEKLQSDSDNTAPNDGEGTNEGSATEALDGVEKAAPQSAKKTKRVWTKENPATAKKKRKKFRYESKAERKLTRFKQKSGNRAKAQKRRQQA